MNVLYVCADPGIPVRGDKGASVHVRSITEALQRLGHEVTLAARTWGNGNPTPRVCRLFELAGEHRVAEGQLEGLIDQEHPEVVIERYSLESGAARVATWRRGLPLTLEVNAPLVDEATRYRNLDNPRAPARERAALRTADRIHVVSGKLLEFVRGVAPDVPSQWIPNGADVASFRAAGRTSRDSRAHQVTFGFTGSMKPWHGVDELLESFALIAPNHPSATLLMVGSGPLEARLRHQAGRLGLDGRVTFTGSLPHSEIPRRVATFDVAVAPYLPLDDFYFQPLKVIEYLAAGKPVIYSDQGDLRELVGAAGIGYAPGSRVELASALEHTLSDPTSRRRMAAAALGRGAELDCSVVARQLLGLAIGSPGAPGNRNPLAASG